MSYSVIIISESASFPWGMAATSRIRSLARGAITNGLNVDYLGIRGADIKMEPGKTYGRVGIESGIPYSYPGFWAVRSTNWWARRFDDITAFLSATCVLTGKKISGKLDVGIIYSRRTATTELLIKVLHLLKVPVILELCEWPLARLKEGDEKSLLSANKFCHTLVPKSEGVLPISTYIDNAVKEIAAKNETVIPALVIPIMIDSVETTSEHNQGVVKKEDYILYSGSIQYVDIAKLVVDILSSLKKSGVVLPLKFTGRKKDAYYSQIKQYAIKKDVFDLLHFTGFVEEDELKSLMTNATCLLAPLPENDQSISRFPTKIGYYLASGTPVVTNNIGEIKRYLRDRESAFVAGSSSPDHFADKIREIIENPTFAAEVGAQGKTVAFKNFHYTTACKGLRGFVEEIIISYRGG